MDLGVDVSLQVLFTISLLRKISNHGGVLKNDYHLPIIVIIIFSCYYFLYSILVTLFDSYMVLVILLWKFLYFLVLLYIGISLWELCIYTHCSYSIILSFHIRLFLSDTIDSSIK